MVAQNFWIKAIWFSRATCEHVSLMAAAYQVVWIKSLCAYLSGGSSAMRKSCFYNKSIPTTELQQLWIYWVKRLQQQLKKLKLHFLSVMHAAQEGKLCVLWTLLVAALYITLFLKCFFFLLQCRMKWLCNARMGRRRNSRRPCKCVSDGLQQGAELTPATHFFYFIILLLSPVLKAH